jgi:type II secretory pathway pseudopilin PulG
MRRPRTRLRTFFENLTASTGFHARFFAQNAMPYMRPAKCIGWKAGDAPMNQKPLVRKQEFLATNNSVVTHMVAIRYDGTERIIRRLPRYLPLVANNSRRSPSARQSQLPLDDGVTTEGQSPFRALFSPRTTNPRRKIHARRAMTLFELTIALFIMTTVMAAIVQLVAVTAGQRRTLNQRRLALLEVANQAERIALSDWDDTSAGKLATWRPSDELTAALPQARCTVAVSDEAGPPAARRIRLTVTWTNSVGQELDPASLTIWKFPEETHP